MEVEAALFLGVATLCLGAGMAQTAGPVANGWPSQDSAGLLRRIRGLALRPPGRVRRAAGGLGLALLLTVGAVTAYAAAPAAPPGPPMAPEPARPAAPDPQLHLILYRGAAGAQMEARYHAAVDPPPAPVLASRPRPPAALDLTRLLPALYVAAAQDEIAAGRWDGKSRWGLGLAETARLVAYDAYRNQAYASWYFAHWRPGARVGGWPSEAQAMGPGYEEFVALNRRRVEYALAHQAQELAANPIRGPDVFMLPPGEVAVQAAMEQGVDPRGLWRLGRADAEGARRMTRLADAPYMIFVPLEVQARLASPPTPAG